ncbi:MAG: hypothetical protein N3F65_02015 [Nitrososphaeria archaeon]|nr:hypothetical protein [Nitrososphaeria archaeon]
MSAAEKRLRIAREELENVINICENVEKRGLNPFTVNVGELLSKLRKMLEENPDLEYYAIDAETMYKIATLIALQHKWLRERAQALFVDAQMIVTRLIAMDKKAIVKAFLRSWRPIISLEQITPNRLRQGMDHFLSLPPRSEGRIWGWRISQREMEFIKGRLAEEEEVAEKVEKLREELLMVYKERGEVDYWEFVRRERFKETFERAYLLSFLITEGYVEVKRNPLKNEIKLIPRKEKVKHEQPVSLVIAIGVSGSEW